MKKGKFLRHQRKLSQSWPSIFVNQTQSEIDSIPYAYYRTRLTNSKNERESYKNNSFLFAEKLAEDWENLIIFDEEDDRWYEFIGKHWQTLHHVILQRKIIDSLVEAEKDSKEWISVGLCELCHSVFKVFFSNHEF
jgi:hypothetical protein